MIKLNYQPENAILSILVPFWPLFKPQGPHLAFYQIYLSVIRIPV